MQKKRVFMYFFAYELMTGCYMGGFCTFDRQYALATWPCAATCGLTRNASLSLPCALREVALQLGVAGSEATPTHLEAVLVGARHQFKTRILGEAFV